MSECIGPKGPAPHLYTCREDPDASPDDGDWQSFCARCRQGQSEHIDRAIDDRKERQDPYSYFGE